MATKKAVKKAVNAEKKVTKKKVVSTEIKATKKAAPCKSSKKNCVVKQQVVSKKQEEFVNNSNSYVLVDYPVENETVYGDNYVLRIGASFDGYVEVSFNDSEWQPCRFAAGYWWYDWTYFKAGDTKIVARLVGNDGKVLKISDIRKCKVS